MLHQSVRYILPILVICLMACSNTVYQSSVPSSPVQLTINTRLGMYVHFLPESTTDYIIVDRNGYHYHDQTMPLTRNDYWGYAGVLIFIDMNGEYKAFDMACPKCLRQHDPVEIDGIFAICPNCGERFDLSYGYATPQKGICKEPLKRYPVIVYSDGIIRIRN